MATFYSVSSQMEHVVKVAQGQGHVIDMDGYSGSTDGFHESASCSTCGETVGFDHGSCVSYGCKDACRGYRLTYCGACAVYFRESEEHVCDQRRIAIMKENAREYMRTGKHVPWSKGLESLD